MPYSYSETVASGDDAARRLIAVPFPYISKEHVKVYLDDTLQPSSAYTWSGTSQIQLAAAPSVGVTRKVQRVTPNTPLVSFASGGVLAAADLNSANLQALYLSQEALDGVADTSSLVETALTYLEDIEQSTNEARDAALDAAERAEASNDAAQAVLAGTHRSVATRTLLAAVPSPTAGTLVYLQEAGREGLFQWKVGDRSASVSADPLQGMCVAHATIPASSGAWERVLYENIRVSWFGAVGDGATDDYAAIVAAAYVANLRGRDVHFEAKTYAHSQTISLNYPVRLSGTGVSHQSWNGYTNPVERTTLKFTGSTGTTNQIEIPHVNFGGGISMLRLDGNARSDRGLLVASSNGGAYHHVYVIGNRFRGVEFTGHALGDTCSWNHVTSLFIDQTDGVAALTIDRDPTNGSNACHILFENLRINFGGTAHGILVRGADNCCFVLPYIYASPGASGYGVYLTPSVDPFFPINNTFYHLQASTRGLYQAAGCTGRTAIIYGYMQDNAQPAPVNHSPVWTLTCSDMPCTPSVTPTLGAGWSGGGVISLYTVRQLDENLFHVRIHMSGTTFSATPNAAILGVLDNFSGWGNIIGVNLNGQAVTGYYSGGTVTLMSGVTSTTGLVLEFSICR